MSFIHWNDEYRNDHQSIMVSPISPVFNYHFSPLKESRRVQWRLLPASPGEASLSHSCPSFSWIHVTQPNSSTHQPMNPPNPSTHQSADVHWWNWFRFSNSLIGSSCCRLDASDPEVWCFFRRVGVCYRPWFICPGGKPLADALERLPQLDIFDAIIWDMKRCIIFGGCEVVFWNLSDAKSWVISACEAYSCACGDQQ